VELAKSTQPPSVNQPTDSTSDAAEEPAAKKRRTSLFAHYRTSHSTAAVSPDAASEQLHRYISVINNESFNPTATSSQLDKLSLEYPLLQPLFSRLFCVPASSAPVERVFSQSGLIMSARRANMSNLALESLVFLKCNTDF